MVALLVQYADLLGMSLTYGEAYRTPRQAKLNEEEGTGIANSLHTVRLAVDFNLFINGEYRVDSESYCPLGEFWEFIGGSWGGRFSKADGNHFSYEHNGVR